MVKRNALAAATEAACTVLTIDETVKNPQSDKPQGLGGKGGGKGMMPPGAGRGIRQMKGRGGR